MSSLVIDPTIGWLLANIGPGACDNSPSPSAILCRYILRTSIELSHPSVFTRLPWGMEAIRKSHRDHDHAKLPADLGGWVWGQSLAPPFPLPAATLLLDLSPTRLVCFLFVVLGVAWGLKI